jgi:hypothetical protein
MSVFEREHLAFEGTDNNGKFDRQEQEVGSSWEDTKVLIRTRLDESFYGPSLDTSWAKHIDSLNLRLHPKKSLSEIPIRKRLMTPTGSEDGPGALPPEWFVGDFEVIEPNKWVLVLSLNPRIDSADIATMEKYRAQKITPLRWREYLQRFNLGPDRYPRFTRPLAQLALYGMDEIEDDYAMFATERMVFMELCPYSSHDFQLGSHEVEKLSMTDPGFITVAWMRDLLIAERMPRFILVNGAGAVDALNALGADRPDWERKTFPSLFSTNPDNTAKELWIQIGAFKSVPIVGFCQLNSRNGHQALPDRKRLKNLVRTHVLRNDSGTP